MGLGKTIEVIALVLAQRAALHQQKQEPSVASDAQVDETKPFRGGTLIVVPSHLASQWVQEIDKALGEGPHRPSVSPSREPVTYLHAGSEIYISTPTDVLK